MSDWDAIVIGAGAAGGIVAGVLCEAGKRVLLLERGRHLSFEEAGRDHVRNQRLSIYGHNGGPDIDGNPRVFISTDGARHVVRPHEPGYNNNASCVGGGSRIYGAQAWRFQPDDFRMASRYGVPEGSSLADWPISYDDLEPWYDRAEWEIGVAGADGACAHSGPRTRGYPMPPVPPTLQSVALGKAAESLGWNTHPVPLLINTVPRAGRAACIACEYCVGFACPTDAKNGSQNTLLQRALATGNCTLQAEAPVTAITTGQTGEVTGVTYISSEDGGASRERAASARMVILSAGAIESARLLLLSRSSVHPAGLGNQHDQVGRSLQGHYYPGAMALMEDTVYDGIGPGVSISTCQFSHGNPGVIGGGMLANEFLKLPIMAWRSMPPEVPRWGAEAKRWMRDNFRRLMHVMGPVQDIPHPDARVELDEGVTDRWGLPVARLSGATHPETVRTAAFMHERAHEWVRAAGAIKTWGDAPGLFLSGGQHQAGTCRMGLDPAVSVTHPSGRVHGHDNLFVIDASLHVTNGGYNPVLTVMANAFRCAEGAAAAL